MAENDWLAEQFEEQRPHLQGVAYRLLGSLNEADDAVQEAWLRLSRSDVNGIENLSGWLTTVVSRVCLDMLRSRKSRREESLDAAWPESVASQDEGTAPEREALLAESVGLALLVVLEKLPPAERIAFVLHDLFAVSFEEIASIVDRSPVATRQLASRARRRVQGAPAGSDTDRARQREIIEAFRAASRRGDFSALLALLDSEVVVEADPQIVPQGAPTRVLGAQAAAEQAQTYARLARFAQLALVNGSVGIVVAPRGRTFAVLAFKIMNDKIIEIDVIADPARLQKLDLAIL